MASENETSIQGGGDDAATDSSTPSRPAQVIAPPVGASAARGFYWLTTLSLINKGVTTVSQIVLFWYISREDFGLLATSTTIATFIGIIQDAGLVPILVRRQRRFLLWCTPVFWLSLALALISATVLTGTGMITAHFLHHPALAGLMAILSVRSLFAAPSAVPLAHLSKDMRFGLLAVYGFVGLVIERSLMILFTCTWWRWGAYGLVIAMTIVTALRTVALWSAAKTPIKWSPRFRRWPYVLRDSWLLSAAQLFQTIAGFGDNLLLALFRSQEVVGDYYWAFNLSMQTTILLTTNLGGVLFPALSKLQREPARMLRAFLRAAKLLSVVGIPCCFLQAAVAAPGVEILFGAKWRPGVPALEVLSVGMAMALLNYPALGLLRAQGRFRTERRLSAACAVMFLIAALIGAASGGALSMAIAVSIYNAIAGTVYFLTATKGTLRQFIVFYAPQLALSAVCIGGAYIVTQMMVPTPNSSGLLWLQIGLTVSISAVSYAIAMRLLMRQVWDELMSHMVPIWRRMKRMIGMASTA
ncbi:MAG TPA: oligosaccharide flippase family protein [Tepidisphaeraceae bacterium]|nr:oligosaccharide flippase family protein [Tepidisphaeraceae bacterium]